MALKNHEINQLELANMHSTRTLLFKTIYLLKRHSRRTKYLRSASSLFQSRRLSRRFQGAFRALKERAARNKEWRKDLVKRYWVDNSDSEGEDLGRPWAPEGIRTQSGDTSQQMAERNLKVVGQVDGFFEDPGSLKEEFFPVRVLRQKRVVNIKDQQTTFMYDREEPMPEFFKIHKTDNLFVDHKI